MARIKTAHRTEALEHILEARIRRGEFHKGERMPSERDLETELGYSRGTIRKAYRSLHHRGVLTYLKRSYRVSGYVDEQDLPVDIEDREFYAIFFSPSHTSPEILAALENVMVKEKLSPLLINLDVMNLSGPSLDLFKVLHVKPRGVFILSHYFGSQSTPLDEKYLSLLPVPYLFISTPLRVRNSSSIIMNVDESMSLFAQYLEEQEGVDKIELLWQWPLSEWDGIYFQKLSHIISGWEKGALNRRWEVKWFSGMKPNFSADSSKTLMVACPSLPYSAQLKGDKIISFSHSEGQAFDAIYLSPMLLVRESIKIMKRRLAHLASQKGPFEFPPL
ncbi:MAG: winged helix-turn-helix transcriptional regulator, partial [Planctomycetes bacterium]|nr:winged helix-turn-helix transcriptional regulator [Planctomycetota bacterium]